MNYADYPLSAPVNITWENTHQCNLSCIHCLSASEAPFPDELTFDECRRVVDHLADLKVFEINFGGGEPFLKDYFLELVDYIHAKRIVTCISTNGTILTDRIVDRLADNPLVNVQVSLDGATEDTNDRIRGAGTYRIIRRGIETLARRRVPFSLNAVVTSLNVGELEQLRGIAGVYGANLRVSRFRPSGRAKASWEDLRLSYTQLERLSGWLAENPSILTGDSFFSVSNRGRRELGLDMCGACKMTCAIDPRGSVYPCAFLQEDEFLGGSFRHSTLKEIWDKSPVFLRLRALEPAACRKCVRLEACHGGCPAVAYFVSKNLDSADPECLVQWKGLMVQ